MLDKLKQNLQKINRLRSITLICLLITSFLLLITNTCRYGKAILRVYKVNAAVVEIGDFKWYHFLANNLSQISLYWALLLLLLILGVDALIDYKVNKQLVLKYIIIGTLIAATSIFINAQKVKTEFVKDINIYLNFGDNQ